MSIPESKHPLEQQTETPEGARADVPDALDGELGAGMQDGPRDVPRPIGRERLRQLREAIENGAYPRDEDVAFGLARLFTRP